MKYLKYYSEKYNIYQNDPSELASDKTYTNKMEADIKEFLTKKVTVDNIYKTYKDEKDLIAKLSAQGFIPQNTSDKKKVVFTNPLIGMYAQASEKKRNLIDLQNQLKQQEDTLQSRKSSISENPDFKDSLQTDIDHTNQQILDIKNKISKLNTEIVTLERNTEKKLREMKNSLNDSNKRINYSIKNRI